MMENKLAKKLKLKAEERNLLLQAPESFIQAVQGTPFDTSAKEEGYDYVQLFVQNQEEVNAYVPDALKAVKEDGKLWLCYPKKSSGIQTDIHRDKGWDVLREEGYAGVAAVSIDNVWSALRFRPESKVERKGGDRQKAGRKLEVPEFLQLALDAHPRERAFFDSLTFTHRKEYVEWITEAKRADTRQRRLQQMLELLKEGKKGRY